MNKNEKPRMSRWEAHRNSLMLSLAFAAFLVGLVYIPTVNAYTYESDPHPYDWDVDKLYTGWDHPAWIKITTTAYSDGDDLDDVEYSTDYGGAEGVYTVWDHDSGVTYVNADQRIAWAQFECIEWWFIFRIRTQFPKLKTTVTHTGGGSFTFTDGYEL